MPPENGQVTLEQLQQQFTELQTKFTDVQKAKEENDKKVQELQKANNELMNTNHKLFLSVTGDRATVDGKEDEPDKEYIDFVGEDFWKTLSKNDKEKLKIILEGDDE